MTDFDATERGFSGFVTTIVSVTIIGITEAGTIIIRAVMERGC